MTTLATYGVCDRCGIVGPLVGHWADSGALVGLCAECDAPAWSALVAEVADLLTAMEVAALN
jgi:hypothetical protein